jgi:hypothetical protein
MFRARTAGSASTVDPPDARPVRASRRQGRREGTGVGALGRGAGLLARVVQFVVSIVVLIIVADDPSAHHRNPAADRRRTPL